MYRAPLNEIRFALHQLAGDGQLSGLPGLPDYSPELADSVLEEAATFAQEVLDPINKLGDQVGAKWTPAGVVMPPQFKDAYEKFVVAGWPQLRASPEHGGQGAPAVLCAAVDELWASANLAFKLCPMLTRGVIEALERRGSEEQKKLYLPKLVSGEWTGTMNLTEPQAGSDLAAVRTRATPAGDHYRLFGQKIFITYGDHDYTDNIIHLVLARIDGAPAGVKGISLFIVPKNRINADGSVGASNDVRTVSIEHKLGIHASPTCVLSYGDNGGAVGYLVGEANRGLEYMFIMMNAARLSVGLEGYAMAERAYQQALEYARTRIQGRPVGAAGSTGGSNNGEKPAPIVYHSDIKRMLMTVKSYTDAARAIALYGALQLDLAEYGTDDKARAAALARGELLIPIIKAWSTELGVQLTSLALQVHGGMGFVEETGAAQYYRDARITPIYEGTTGIQAMDLVGRKVGRDGGAAMSAFIADMQDQLSRISSSDASAQDSKRAVLEALDLLRAATDAVLVASKKGLEHVQAISVPYLMLAGTVIGGWTVARGHALSLDLLAENPEFFKNKQQLARFYIRHILPEAHALAKVVQTGTGSVVEADPTLF